MFTSFLPKILGIGGLKFPGENASATYWDQHFSCWKFSGDVSSCTTSSDTSSDSQPKNPHPHARFLDWRLKDHLHTVQVYFQAPFRSVAAFQGWDPGSPFHAWFVDVCRGSHWKALKNATDLLPKTEGGVAEIITA